jgi:H+/Cl- antiporter ClcA
MNLGRLLILAGLVLVALGLLALAMNRFNLPLGRLPGDIVWRGKNTTLYIPWVTCLLLSLLGTLLLWLLGRRG